MGKKQAFQWDSMTMGTCYYPEHWDQKLWDEDSMPKALIL